MPRFVGEFWRDAMGVRHKTKFRWNKGELERKFGLATAVALQRAGLEVRKQTQRSMVGGSSPTGRQLRATPVWWRVGEYNGYPVVAYVKKVPKPEKVSSWAPKAFLRNDVQSDYDPGTKSVVIGPSKFPWLNRLHEFGGTVSVYVNHGKAPVKEFGGSRVPRKYQRQVTGPNGKTRYDGAYVGVFNNKGGSFRVGTRNVRGRRYMEIGLMRSLRRIPKEFRDMISVNGKIKVFGEKSFRR